MLASALALFLLTPARAALDVELVGRARQPGEVLLVAVQGADANVPPTGRFEDETLRFFPGGAPGRYLAFVGLDLDVKIGTHTLTLSTPEPWSTTIDVLPKEFPTRRLQVEGKYVAPPKEDEERASLEALWIANALARSQAKRYFTGRFETPIPGAPSSRFGERSVFNGVPKAPHSGADLRAKTGVEVRAPEGGKVVLAGDYFYQGSCVYLDHGFGIFSAYFHLSKIDVKAGQLVKKGDVLGRVGMTGRATGPHLHWSVRAAGARVDPFSLTALDLDAWLSSHKRHDALTSRP